MSVFKGSLPFYLAVGLLQAMAMVLALEFEKISVAVGVLVFGGHLQLLGSHFRQRGAWILAGLLALVLTLVTEWVLHEPSRWWREDWTLGALIVGYTCSAFILSWPSGSRLHLPYRELFRHAWNNALILLLALLLTGLFWSLLQLCVSLFEMIGITAFKEVIKTRNFNIISLSLVCSLGIRMGCENDKVIGMLRGILLNLCRFLAPLSALIVVLFTLALPFTGLESIWKTGHATTILLGLVAANIFLINGVFQDGNQPRPYPQWLMWGINASLLALPVLVVLAGYSTWLRIEQYGLSPSRIVGLLSVVAAALYSLAAVWAVLRSGSVWLGNWRVTNPWLALLVCLVVVLIYTPWLNPQKFSARDQVQRLKDGRTSPDSFDTYNLRNRLGKPGRQEFERLLADMDSLQQFEPEVRARLKTRMYDTYNGAFRYIPKQPVPEHNFIWIGLPVDGHEQFSNPELGSLNCNRYRCGMWAVDLDGDGQNEVIQFSSEPSQMYFFRFDSDGVWKEAGRMDGPSHSAKKWADLVREGKTRVVEPTYRSLEIGGQLYTPTETDRKSRHQ
ncbi:hypothetical protein ALQ04_03805 [Pseudomonas cichorii]|uniref:DUF4153 domain-containing protein n=1 Tax=Pseudomonas cichorii TaxID=36746 RepID=A0A3M4M9U4_PSECI|nr:DUF4153 domain-containing protein [Pseudomonas cichorii]RMQ50570.1 hypothetical protein ALQ04_03805 [Pseudomonas cichorii]